MPQVRRSGRRSDVEVKYEEEDELAGETPPAESVKSEESEQEDVEEQPAAPKGLSAFEKRRLENIAANQALLKDISATANKITANGSAPRSRSAKKSTPKRREVVKKETIQPTRRSSRVAGLAPEKDENKRGYDAIVAGDTAEERVKKMRISGDLSLGDTLVEGKKWAAGLDGLASLKGLSRGAQPGLRTFTDEDIEATSDKGLKELRKRMNNLKLYEGWMPNDIKITPLRAYSLGFHPTEDKAVIFAGDKEGAIGVFDASQETPSPPDDDDEEYDYPDPVISAFKFHTKTASAFVFSPADANAVFTSSYDSTIRKLDLGKSTSYQIFAPSDPSEDLAMSAMEMPFDDPNMLYFSTLHGGFGRHDIRTPSHKHETWGLCDNKIGGFSLHPRQPHLVATASLDRTVKIWDLRKISGKGDMRHPALLGEHHSRLSVSYASWSPAGHLATSSYDDTIKIYDFKDAASWSPGHDIGDAKMEPATTVRHNNQTGRWVTILKPKFQTDPKDGIQKFVIGNMNRFVDVYAADGEQLAQLDGEGISAVPAVAHFHPSMDWVAGANGSGKLTLWM